MGKTDQEHHPHTVAVQAPADPRTCLQPVLTLRHQTLLASGARGRNRHDQRSQLPTTTRTGLLHLLTPPRGPREERGSIAPRRQSA
eukprot:2006179-Pyramimonas_sp.AAC.1